jgi:hypothetical protein
MRLKKWESKSLREQECGETKVKWMKSMVQVMVGAGGRCCTTAGQIASVTGNGWSERKKRELID